MDHLAIKAVAVAANTSKSEAEAWEWVRRLADQANHLTLGISIGKYDVTDAAKVMADLAYDALEARQNRLRLPLP